MDFKFIIMAVFLAGLGLFSALHPEDAIYLQNFYRFRDFEPEDYYIRWTRIGGWVCVALAVICIICAFTA